MEEEVEEAEEEEEEEEVDEVEGEERPSQIEWRLLVKGCDSDDVSEYDRGQKGGGG